MTDWFKKALLPAAGAVLAVPILADESEAASFPKDAVVKHLKKIAGPEFSKIPQESIDNVLKWSTHDVPKSFGLDKPATNQADRNLLETALNSPFVYNLNPKDFNNLRLAQSVFPEEAIGRINPSFKFLDPQSGSLGNYIFNGKTGKSTISYNPVKAKSTTPPHELTHGVQDVPSFRAEFNRPTNLNLDAMEKTTNDYANLIEGAPFKLSQLTPEYIKSIPEHIDLIKALKESYKHNPAETMARDVADYFEGGLLNKDYQGLKNYSNFKDVFSDSAKTAFEDYKKKFPQRGYEIAREVVDEAIKSGKYKHLSKAALATPFAFVGTSHASTPNQEKSNFDGLVNDDGVYGAVKRVEDEKILKSPKGIWELGKMIPGLVAPAIPAVRQMISGFVEDEVKKIGKSAKKLVSLKEGDKADWEDYANVLQLADKPGLLMMGHDVAKGIGEPVGKRIAEGINDFYESNRVASEFFDGQ